MDTQNLVTKLKNERDYLLSQTYVPRTAGEKLEAALNSDLIKVITGPRRAGKSTVAIQILKQFPDFLYINFDSQDVIKIEDKYSFITSISSNYTNGKRLLLDEIQNVPQFELLVSELQRNGFNIVMTGSNANLLSRELSTHLTGRFVQIEVLPFSFTEAKGLLPDLTLLDYLRLGGFPEQLKTQGKVETYLPTLFESIILKDIVTRYELRNTLDLLNLSTYLLNTPSQPTNFTRLRDKLGMNSTNTTIDYYGYLEEAYLIHKLPLFSWRDSEVIRSDFKTYLVDTGLFTTNSSKFEQNLGHLFENAVFTHLLRQGHRPQIELFQLRNSNSTEVDFYVRGEEKILIQACLSVKDNGTREREFAAISESKVDYNSAYVVVLDPTEAQFSTEKVKVISFEDWVKEMQP